MDKLNELSNAVKAALDDLSGKKATALDEELALKDLLNAIANQNAAKVQPKFIIQLNQFKIEEATKRLEKAQSKLGSQVRAESRKTDDPGRKQQLAKAIDDLERLIPVAKSLANKPHEKEKLHDVHDDILEKLGLVSSPETALADLAKKEELLLHDMLQAAKGSDPNALEKVLYLCSWTN